MDTIIIKKLALYVSIAGIGFLAATALIPGAHAASNLSVGDSIEAGLKQQCQTTFRSGDTQFIGTDCDYYSLIAINTRRKLAVVIDPSADAIEGFKLLSKVSSGTGLKTNFDEKTKILAIDASNVDEAALSKVYKDAWIDIQTEKSKSKDELSVEQSSSVDQRSSRSSLERIQAGINSFQASIHQAIDAARASISNIFKSEPSRGDGKAEAVAASEAANASISAINLAMFGGGDLQNAAASEAASEAALVASATAAEDGARQ